MNTSTLNDMTPTHRNLGPKESEHIIMDLRCANHRLQVLRNHTDKDSPHGDASSYLHTSTFRSLEREDKEAEWKTAIEIDTQCDESWNLKVMATACISSWGVGVSKLLHPFYQFLLSYLPRVIRR